MKIDLNNLATALVKLNIPAESQGKFIQAAVARTLAFGLPLPAEAPGPDHFESLKAQIAPSLDGLVERFPIDFDETLALTGRIYNLRVSLLHPVTSAQEEGFLSICCQKGMLECDVDFADPAVSLLAGVIKGGAV